MSLKTLVVDDSVVFRKSVRDAIEDIYGLDVIDIARDGNSAVEKICRLQPDFVTLDIEMPGMNGFEVLKTIRDRGFEGHVVVVSGVNQSSVELTSRSLTLGALGFIVKPDHDDPQENLISLRMRLRHAIAGIDRWAHPTPAPHAIASARVNQTAPIKIDSIGSKPSRSCAAVLIGISTGGPKALAKLIPAIPSDFPAPIIIVQHMPAMFTASMAQHLNESSALDVVEAVDGMAVKAGQVVIAPGGKHLELSDGKPHLVAHVTDDAPVRGCKPSVDKLFQSIPASIARQTLGIIMTGMGDDGTAGCRYLSQHGGTVWAQDAASCTVYGMPKRVVESGNCNATVALDDLAKCVADYAAGSTSRCGASS
ncbi:MAG: chemotaxis-specific protein-glutamate methyltransferase CheB [Planctomycetota bacterium]